MVSTIALYVGVLVVQLIAGLVVLRRLVARQRRLGDDMHHRFLILDHAFTDRGLKRPKPPNSEDKHE